jgi:membrane protease YdiL (CAAX protease family)
METRDKKKLWIFIAIAYGVAYLMNLIMIIGFFKEYDLTLFVNAQMMYPACGVILGKLIFKKEGEKLPMVGYITVLVTTALSMLCSLGSIIIHIEPIDLRGVATLDIWSTIGTLPLLFGSLVAYVAFWVCGKEKRENAGLQRKNIVWSIILIAVFVALFFGRTILGAFLSDLFNHTNEGWISVKEGLISKNFVLSILVLPINFFFCFIAFFGEEYGWRYYLQPIMQDKMGKRLGVILLGVIWGFWHIGVDYMFYTTKYGTQALVSQIITCIVIAVFFGFAYMKTRNIWVVVIMHYLNNNLAAALGGGDQALQNQVIPWSTIPIHALSSIVFLLFIFAPIFNKKKVEKTEEQSEEN